MIPRDDPRDRLIDVLLEELFAPARSIDLEARVLARAFPPRRRRAWVQAVVLAAAAALLVAFLLRRDEPESNPLAPLDRVSLERSGAPPRGTLRFDTESLRMGGEPHVSQEVAAPAFVARFPFRFRLPADLPGGWRLLRARALEGGQALLVYDRGDHELTVVLFAWPGPDEGPRRHVDGAGGRPWTVVRRKGVGIAILGGRAEADVWEAVAKAFLGGAR